MLMRTGRITLWHNFVAPVGAISGVVSIARNEFTGAFIRVSAATDIELQVETVDGWFVFDTTRFAAAGNKFLNIWSLPFENIRFRTTAAATITIQVFQKT